MTCENPDAKPTCIDVYISVLEFDDLKEFLGIYIWLNIIIKVAAPPCTESLIWIHITLATLEIRNKR
jgi:hypothetical protein